VKVKLLTPALALLALAAAAPAASAQSAPLSGPPGDSLNKVLVIGTDGTRWDLVKAAMRSGKAPNLRRLKQLGFGKPSQLGYAPPEALTLSEVGWSSIASGVWPAKHGVFGFKLNMDPGQATKNGYSDFLTRIESVRARTSTFLASDWSNIGLPKNGGPLFGSAMDARYALDTTEETLEAWNAGDEAVTAAASRYLRRGDPDAGFVYLGLVDETAHLVGSALPPYAASITTTDARIGRLLSAIRARPTYPFESWTVLVTTDHGQRPYDYPSVASHIGGTPLEQTSFVFGAGPGLTKSVKKPLIVDIAPTVLHQLGLGVPAKWNLDGRSLSAVRPPSSADAVVFRHGLLAHVELGVPHRATNLRLRLPAGVRLVRGARVAVVANGHRVQAFGSGRNVLARLGGVRLRSVTVASGRDSLRIAPGAKRNAEVKVFLRSGGRTLGPLAVPLDR
jgi:hypothetical protein